MLGDVLHLDRVAQVRFVGAVLRDRRVVRNTRPVVRHRLAACEFFEQAGDDRLHRREDIVLLNETHFDIELIELARQAIGARVFIAKTRRDLEVTVEAGNHQ